VLARGENRVWPHPSLELRVTGATTAVLALDADRRPLAPPWRALSTLRLDETPPDLARLVVVAWGFATPPTTEVVGLGPLAPLALTGETALVLAEVYRHGGGWKLRHVGQGYAGGLAELARALGAPPPPQPAAEPAAPAAPVPDPVRHLAMVLDDAAKATASVESTLDFARRRLEQELDLDDPRLRTATDSEPQRRHDAMVAEARRRYAGDTAQLARELADLEPTLPAALARWDAPAWSTSSLTGGTLAVRVGELSPAEAPELGVPLVFSMPLSQPLWLDLAELDERTAADAVRGLAVRLAVAAAPGVRVSVVDVGGRLDLPSSPGRLEVHHDAGSAARALQEHVEHLDLVEMALSGGHLEDLPPQHRPGRALVLHDVPTGLSEDVVRALLALSRRGPRAGLSVVLSGQPAADGLLAEVAADCLRLPGSGGELYDAVRALTWTFAADPGPTGPAARQSLSGLRP
jgi:hypothetical protein